MEAGNYTGAASEQTATTSSLTNYFTVAPVDPIAPHFVYYEPEEWFELALTGLSSRSLLNF